MSSDSLLRPSSSLSIRPTSRTSQRPLSRFSQISTTRQTRINPWLKTLIRQVVGVDEVCNLEDFQEAWGIASRHVDQLMQSSSAELSRVDAQINGHVTKAQIHVQDVLANKLRVIYSKLMYCMESQRSGLDAVINPSNIPTIVQFLLHLSSPPNAFTLAYATGICQGSDSEQLHPELTWTHILNEEPFEGQHWQGAYGLPPGSTVETWDSESSEMDLSSRDDDEFEYQFATPPTSFKEDDEDNSCHLSSHSSHGSFQKGSLSERIIVENLLSLQHWNSSRFRSSADSYFGFNKPWTLGPISDSLSTYSPPTEGNIIYIKEVDVIREILFLLQGLPSILFNHDADNIEVDTHRRISHLTHTAQTSILNVFASRAAKMKPLRSLVTGLKAEQSSIFQAFITGVARQLQKFDIWCSNLETQISATLLSHEDLDIEVISLLQLKYQVEKRTAHIFDDLLGVLRMWESRPVTRLPGQLINLVWQCLKKRQTLQDGVTAQALWEVLKVTVEPFWSSLGRWLKDGIPIDLGLEEGEFRLNPTWNVDEFFVRINPLIDTAAPDFWEAKYTLQRNPTHVETAESPVPLFLAELANHILAAGKSVGFIRAMGLFDLWKFDRIQNWITFEDAVSGFPLREVDFHLKERMSNLLMVPCRVAQTILSRVLVDETHLWKHLRNMEAICLMTRGDLMGQFNEQLFSKMDSSRYIWHDYHFMNAAFRKAAKLDHLINPSLVTFSYKTIRDRTVDRTVTAIEGLSVEYAVPFPLVYLFGSESSTSYSQIFCFLLQIQRSKSVLDQISLNKVNAQFSKQRPFLMTFYLIRWRLSWFVGTLSSFIKMHVIDVATRDFHKSLLSAASLDEMIHLHHIHLERLLNRAFLRENTSALHRAILSILNLSLRLNVCLMAHKTNDRNITRSSRFFKSSLSRHPNARRGRKKMNVIGFVEAMSTIQSSDEDDSSEDETSIEKADFEVSEPRRDEDDGLEQINRDLESLMAFVLRGVQVLASGITDDSAAFGILAFLLEGETQ